MIDFTLAENADHATRMRLRLLRSWKWLLFCLILSMPAVARVDARAAQGSRALPKRTLWTQSKVRGSPDPPPNYRVERVFPSLEFKDPIDLETLPGSDRIVVAELGGKIFAFPAKPGVAGKDLLIDLTNSIPGASQLYGFTFDPKFAKNHFIYICYVLKDGDPAGSRVSRFTVSDRGQIDPQTERIIITWVSGGHNGGCLKFGPDRFLYITTGDAAGPNPPDPLNTGQDVSDLLSSILRIDVEQEDPPRHYRVPPDNPLVGTDGARPEIWAYGFRNPWKMSFDQKTGDLWVADVGWELWELVYRVERGGNYGWSIMEGRQSIKPEGKHGPTPILPPVLDHPHSEAASITGGLVYRGRQNPELDQAYVYGDWETRKLWALRYQDGKVTWRQELLDTGLRIISFAEDPARELLILDYQGGIYQLFPNRTAPATEKFPTRLSQTGLFQSTRDLKPAPGVISYTINAEAWADHARAERLLGLPGESQVDLTNGKAAFPRDAVLLKTFFLELEERNPRSTRRIESQLLHFNGTKWQAYTYQWNDQQTDAELVPAEGRDIRLTVRDASAPGGTRSQHWHFAARSECLRCHNPWAGPPLAFDGLQLNRLKIYPGGASSQIQRLVESGTVTRGFAANRPSHLFDPSDQTAALAPRARSYLHVNCAHCHRENAGGAVNSWMNYELPLEKMSLVGTRPTQGTFGLAPAFVVAPGDPFHSVLYYRVSKVGPGRMPHLGSEMVDEQGTALLRDWIAGLSGTASAAAPAGRPSAVEGEAVGKLCGGADQKEARSLLEGLLGSTSGALALMSAVASHRLPAPLAEQAVRAACGKTEAQIRDLFERFLPDEQRSQRGSRAVDPAQVLSRNGEASRGRKIFFENSGVQCARCHRAGGEGGEYGPDLSQIGRKYNARELLDHILNPSKVIDPNYLAYSVLLKDGGIHTGLLLKKTTEEIVVKESEREEVHLRADAVERVQTQAISAMPEGLLQSLGPGEIADLLKFLSSLK